MAQRVKELPVAGTASAYLQSVIDSLVDELIVVDRDFRIVQVNEAALKRHGLSREQAIGRFCHDVSHGSVERCHEPRHACPIHQVWQTGEPARATHVHVYETDGRKKPRYVDIIASPILDAAGRVTRVVELMRDVTESKEMELEIGRAHQKLLALHAIANVVSQSLDLDTVLQAALDKTLELLKVDTGGILLWDEESRRLRYRVHHGLSAAYVRSVSCRLGEGISGLAASTGKPVLVEDISSDPRAAHHDLIAAEGLKGFASVPLTAKSGLLGVLTVAGRDARRFSEQDVQLLENITGQVAIAIENARLLQELRRQDTVRGKLLSQLFSIQEEERKRIGRELHDETAQSLVALATSLEMIRVKLPETDAELKTQVKSLQQLALHTLDEMNNLIYELRPSMLDDLGLVAAARAFASRELQAAGVELDFRVVGREKRLAATLESTLFRVIQEAINNIVRHAQARHVSVLLQLKRKRVVVRIADDGRGFDVKEALNTRQGMRGLGLLGMRERVLLVDGTLEIKSSAGGSGTEIALEIPVAEGKIA